jgi:nicotinate-nucleotide adenylyltransferase
LAHKDIKRIRIGIFGGTFDPPHKAHIAIANQARRQLHLNKLYFVPAYIPPHKQFVSTAGAKDRLKMVKLAIRNRKGFLASDLELKRYGISYTIDTLKTFKRNHSNAALVLIIGADNLAQFRSWKSREAILKLASLAVYRRKGFNWALKKKIVEYFPIKGELYQISSTGVRNRILKGLSISALVPKSVALYIRRHLLYNSVHLRSFK